MPENEFTPLHSCVSVLKDINELVNNEENENEMSEEFKERFNDLLAEIRNVKEVEEIWLQFEIEE